MGEYTNAAYGASLYGSQVEHPYRATADKVMWLLQVDWQNLGVFGSAIEPQSISAISITRGRKTRLNSSGTALAQPDEETFSITINDPNGRYDPYNNNGPLLNLLGRPAVPMRLLIVSTTSKESALPVFSGSLTQVQFHSATATATLSGQGTSALWQQPAIAPSQPFSAGGWEPTFSADGSTPFPINYWHGRPGGLSLQRCADIIAERTQWPGGLVFGSVPQGEIEPEYFLLRGKSGWQTMMDLCAGFLANLFFLRDGTLFVMDASDAMGLHPALPAPGAALRKNGFTRSAPFHSLRNQVRLTVNPFSVPPFAQPTPSSSYKTAWTSAGPIRVLAGQQLEFDVEFSDADDRCFQGNYARVPTDSPLEDAPIKVFSQADGGGVNMGASTGNGEGEFTLVSEAIGQNDSGIIYTQFGGEQSRCRVRLKNWSASRTAYFFNLRVLVAGISRAGDALTVTATDDASIAVNSLHPLLLNSDLVQSVEMAQVVGRYALRAMANRARAAVCGLSYGWHGQALYNSLQTYDLGSHIDLGGGSPETYGLAGRHLLVGQDLAWQSADGQGAWVTLWLQKAQPMPARVTAVTSSSGANVASLSWQHSTLDTPSLLLVQVSMRSFGQLTAAAFAGHALSRVGQVSLGYPTNGNFPRVELWALPQPPAILGTITVTLSLADYIECGALTLSGVDESSPFGEIVTSKASSGNATLSATAQDGDLFVGCVGTQGSATSANTALWSVSSDGNWRGSAASQDGDGTVTLSWQGISGGHAALGVMVRAKYH